MKTWLARAALLLTSFAVCLFIGEIFLRIAFQAPSHVERDGQVKYRFTAFRPDGSLGYRLRSNWSGIHETHVFSAEVQTNNLGLRRAEDTQIEKPPGATRILLLGDSFAFGFGVGNENTFSALLERRLRKNGLRAEVINAGVPGYSSDHYLVYLEREGFALDPDLILIATCENDIDDLRWSKLRVPGDGLPTRTVSRRRMIDRHGKMRYVNEAGLRLPGLLDDPPRWLLDHSRLFNWVRFRIARVWIKVAFEMEERAQSQQDDSPAPTAPIPSLTEEEINRGLTKSPAFRSLYYAFLNDAIEQEAARRATPLRFIHIGPQPGPVQADCAQRASCFDASTTFSRDSAPEAFHTDDGHWTEQGHRRISGVLFEALWGTSELRQNRSQGRPN